MKIIIKAIKIDLTPALEEYIEKKISTLSRLLARFEKKRETSAFVEIARTTLHHKGGDVYLAEVNLDLGFTILRAGKSHRDARAAVDLVKDALREQIVKYKKKVIGR